MRGFDWQRITRHLDNELGIPLRGSVDVRAVGGGDISSAWCLDDGERCVFLKTGPDNSLPLFECEHDGLEALAAAAMIRVPGVLGSGLIDNVAVLALEWLELAPANAGTERRLGERLAAQHRLAGSHFGWHRDNFIGSTPQPNKPETSWLAFFAEHRLGWQLKLAERNGYRDVASLGERLLLALPDLLGNHSPEASLLHGDLWAGNHAAAGGEPAVFDPAVHYGDRECDLAMTRLFGGYGQAFYRAYETAWPLPPGHANRLPLYQLYHVLNHLNLFGGAYASRALRTMRDLLVQVP
jgi:fructosamine-3-kinase